MNKMVKDFSKSEVHRLCNNGDRCPHFHNGCYCKFLHKINKDGKEYLTHINDIKLKHSEDIINELLDVFLNHITNDDSYKETYLNKSFANKLNIMHENNMLNESTYKNLVEYMSKMSKKLSVDPNITKKLIDISDIRYEYLLNTNN